MADLDFEPISREEQYLARIAGQNNHPYPAEPISRIEMYLDAIAGGGTGGVVNSVNGKSGTVVLDAGDIKLDKTDENSKTLAEFAADAVTIIKITDTSTTMGDVAAQLNTINTNGEHVLFDVSALGASMYLCTIFIDTTANAYKIVDIVVGRVAEGAYNASKLLTMAIAGANAIATQSQIDNLQRQVDELGGSEIFSDWEALGNLILSGDPDNVISAGDTVDVNWNKTVLGTTTNGLTVTCTDRDKFVAGVGEAEAKDYLFVYNGSAWTYNEEAISLADFGLSVSGTPATGEVMTISTTVDTVEYTFTSKDTVDVTDANVPHNWLLEQTYAPDTKADRKSVV